MEHENSQIASLIYHRVLSIMKFTLDLEEQKYLERGRQDDRYKFFKKQLMSHTYDNLRSLFKEFEDFRMIQPTSYPEDVKDGYKPTPSGGSGYVNTNEMDEWLNSQDE